MPSSVAYAGMDDSIEIRVITEEDWQRVLDFTALYFFAEEPLSIGCEPKDVLVYGADALLCSIRYGSSFMAVLKETDEIVGLTITGPKLPGETEELYAEATKCGDTKFATILKFIAAAEQEADIFKRYNVDRILYVSATCVKAEMRGRNVGARLYNAVHDLGKKMGFELLASACASFYSARIKERLGWDCVNTIYYKDYTDNNNNNKPVFTPPAPHVCCKICVIRL